MENKSRWGLYIALSIGTITSGLATSSSNINSKGYSIPNPVRAQSTVVKEEVITPEEAYRRVQDGYGMLAEKLQMHERELNEVIKVIDEIIEEREVLEEKEQNLENKVD